MGELESDRLVGWLAVRATKKALFRMWMEPESLGASACSRTPQLENGSSDSHA